MSDTITTYLYQPSPGQYLSDEYLYLNSNGTFKHSYTSVNIDYGYNTCSGEETYVTQGTYKIENGQIFYKFKEYDGFESTGKFNDSTLTCKRTPYVDEQTYKKVEK